MAIKWFRIDDRLIHGQVATSWLRHVNADQIICISDAAVNNPIQVQVLKMAAPDLKVHVFGVEQFIGIYANNPIKRSTFLIAESLADLLLLKEGGVDIEYINYGGQRKREDRTCYEHDLCFSEEELKALDTLESMNIKIEYQIAAFDAPVSLREQLEKARSQKQ